MINYEFISKLEGMSLVGYVPKPDGGRIESGVTVACGFDIGQRSLHDLKKLPALLVTKLQPYLSVTGLAAVNLLVSRPLKITKSDCRLITMCAYEEATQLLLEDWQTSLAPVFSSLADECQTVIASVAFQYGDLPSRTPNFWRQVTTGDWQGALTNLREFGDNFNTRRNKEADLLESRLNQYTN